MEEEIKKEYDELVDECEDIIYALRINPKNDPKALEIILKPKNIKEYELAIAVFTYFSITTKIISEGSFELDKENNFFYNLYIDLIKAIDNNQQDVIDHIKENLADFSKTKRTPIILANIAYDLNVFISNYTEEVFDEMLKECGYNPDDEEDLIKFNRKIYEAKEIIQNSSNVEKVDLNNILESGETTLLIEMVKEYKKLYENKSDNKVKVKLY